MKICIKRVIQILEWRAEKKMMSYARAYNPYKGKASPLTIMASLHLQIEQTHAKQFGNTK